jgi:hypothetical protein
LRSDHHPALFWLFAPGGCGQSLRQGSTSMQTVAALTRWAQQLLPFDRTGRRPLRRWFRCCHGVTVYSTDGRGGQGAGRGISRRQHGVEAARLPRQSSRSGGRQTATAARRSGSGGLTSVYGKSPVRRQGVRLNRCVAPARRCGAPVDLSETVDGPQRQRPGSHAVGKSNTDRLVDGDRVAASRTVAHNKGPANSSWCCLSSALVKACGLG